MASAKRRSPRDYPLAFKLSVVGVLNNALAERVNGILKTELMLQRPQDLTQTKTKTKTMVSESVWIYNSERPHLSLKYKTPDAVHRAFG